MNFIVIDLEWNQCPLGKENEVKEIPFEIIEIGAVKLNEHREVIDEFHEYINPQVYLEFHEKSKEVLHISMSDLKDASSFKVVAEHFLKWLGDDYVFCTWGPMDLEQLQRNLDYFKVSYEFAMPLKYYDIQKLFRMLIQPNEIVKTLEYAVDYFGIPKQEQFHTAICDARYTARVFHKLNLEKGLRYYSIDYYHHPLSKAEEIYAKYDFYCKYISREFDTKAEAFLDKNIREMVCFHCGRKATKRIKWHAINQKQYLCVAHCKKHGFLKGKVRIKKTANNKVFVVKTVKSISKEEADAIFDRLHEIAKKKKEKKRLKKGD
ncbi:probable DNA polymerase III epsilon chain [Lachnospiraceae bacterium KM106-2]|nr:probable DNA polymerase III epsilon chain [Lachnospiraceae bacterium KM106-2]